MTNALAARQISIKPPAAASIPVRSAPGAAPAGTLELMGTPMPFARNAEIYGEDEPAEYLYKVISGTVRTCRILSDGRRQVGAFYLPGDVFGLDTGDSHQFSAEAITDSTILVIRRSAVLSLANRDGDVARQLWASTARELQRVQNHMLLLIKSARERLASFLIEMADRLKSREAVDLPMSRQDIADYLGLTIETVSRTFSTLELAKTIAIPSSRRILLRDREALVEIDS